MELLWNLIVLIELIKAYFLSITYVALNNIYRGLGDYFFKADYALFYLTIGVYEIKDFFKVNLLYSSSTN